MTGQVLFSMFFWKRKRTLMLLSTLPRPLVVVIGYMIFVTPFLDVIRMSMSTVFFLV